MSNIYDSISVPEPRSKEEGSLEEYLDLGHDTPRRSRRHTVKQFCQNVLHSQEYRESLFRRIDSDSLPPQIETLLYSYAYGKPVERVEFNDVTESNLEGKSLEELEAKAAQLKKMLAQRVEHLRREQQRHEFDELSTTKLH